MGLGMVENRQQTDLLETLVGLVRHAARMQKRCYVC